MVHTYFSNYVPRERKGKLSMKKLIRVVALTLVMVTMLAACGKKFTCDMCFEEKSGKQYKKEVFGEEVVLCKECNKEYEAAEQQAKQLLDAFS